MARRRPRPTDPEIRYRNMLEASGLPALAGLSRVGLGASSGRGLAPSVVGDGALSNESGGFAAQLLVMTATSDSIASGGDYVVFDTIVAQHGFRDVVAMTDGIWTHPIGAVYILEYEHDWDTYTAGGTIRLEIDGVLVPEGVIATGTSGSQGRGTIAYVAAAGSTGRIKVTQSSGSAKTCDALVRVAVSDPMQPDQAVADLGSNVVSLGTEAAPDVGTWAPSGWSDSAAHWIWFEAAGGSAALEAAWFQGTVDSTVTRNVSIEVAADNYVEVYLNGTLLGTHGSTNGVFADEEDGYTTRTVFSATLIAGRNRVSAKAVNGQYAPNDPTAGFILSMSDGVVLLRTTDEGGWTVSTTEPSGWPLP